MNEATRGYMNTKLQIGILAAALVTHASLRAQVGFAQDTTASERPNVVVILVDDVAHDRWTPSAEGSPPQRAFMPNAAFFAARSTAYPNFYTLPVCSPSRITALTGLHPETHGVGEAIKDGAPYQFPPIPTLAHWLHSVGYQTVAAGKWHIDARRPPPMSPGPRGFERWRIMLERGSYYSGSYTDDGGPEVAYPGYLPEAFSDYVVDVVASNLDQPLFLWYGMTLAHGPFLDPPPHLHSGGIVGTDDTASYLRMLEAADTLLGRLLSAIEQHRPNTYVFLMGDNGTPVEVSLHPSAKGSMKEPGINCPLHIQDPSMLPGEDRRLCHIVDLAATIMHISGASRQPLPTAGVSMLGPVRRAYVVSQRFIPNGSRVSDGTRTYDDWALIEGPWKILRRLGAPDRLFHLGDPRAPWDGSDVSGAHPAVLQSMQATLDAHIASLP